MAWLGTEADKAEIMKSAMVDFAMIGVGEASRPIDVLPTDSPEVNFRKVGAALTPAEFTRTLDEVERRIRGESGEEAGRYVKIELLKESKKFIRK